MGNTHPQADSQFTQIQHELKSHLNFKLRHKVNRYFKINPSTIVFNNNSVFFCACFDLLAWTCGCVLALFMMTVPTEQGVPWKSIWLQEEKCCAEGKPKLHRKTQSKESARETAELLQSNYQMAFGRMGQRGVIIALQQKPLSSPGERTEISVLTYSRSVFM